MLCTHISFRRTRPYLLTRTIVAKMATSQGVTPALQNRLRLLDIYYLFRVPWAASKGRLYLKTRVLPVGLHLPMIHLLSPEGRSAWLPTLYPPK
jgi:hypothetical protein